MGSPVLQKDLEVETSVGVRPRGRRSRVVPVPGSGRRRIQVHRSPVGHESLTPSGALTRRIQQWTDPPTSPRRRLTT